MKKLLFILCLTFFLALPNTSYAETYTNQTYNFEVTFPSGWINPPDFFIHSLIEKAQFVKTDEGEYYTIISIRQRTLSNFTDLKSFDEYNDEQKQIFLDEVTTHIKSYIVQANSIDFISSEYTTIGDKTMLVIKYDVQFDDLTLHWVDVFVVQSDQYINFALISDDTDISIYLSQFYQMLATYKEININHN